MRKLIFLVPISLDGFVGGVNGELKGLPYWRRQQAGKNILIFSSPSISQLLMRHRLIDSYRIFINTGIFEEGIPLFSDEQRAENLNYYLQNNC